MEIAKALILAGTGPDCGWPAGGGSRHLFPLANRPILFHNLEALRSAGILEALILTDADASGAIEAAVGSGRSWDLSVAYGELPPASAGLAATIASVEDFCAGEPVLVAQADALLRGRLHGHLSTFARDRLDALALRLDDSALTPGYLLSPRAVSILREDAAADPLAGVRAAGGRVGVARVEGFLPCHGDVEALLATNRFLLEGLKADAAPEALEESTVQGPVQVHPTAKVRRSLLRGPAIIGPGATVTDGYVGPYTSIGADVRMDGAEIEHSIVLAGAQLRFVGTRLESSVIGRGARVGRGFDVPAAMRVSLGDGAEVVLR
jgi:glucose-1-phosphate thymidylyltransferase